MADIQIFFRPPMAIARLGGSDTPLASFRWDEDPSLHGAGQTVILPEVSLSVQPDGSIRPFRPNVIQFRDGELYRPVAPFFELWAVIGDKEPFALTAEWLQERRASLKDLTYTVTAANRKAERRTHDPACGFSASIQVSGNDHASKPLLASSPEGRGALVKKTAPIPLGSFRVIRPSPGTAMDIDLSVLRVRFTPATGQVYGPPNLEKASDEGRKHVVVPPQNRILNSTSSWNRYEAGDDSPQPSDTYDGADRGSAGERSMGVVDDTCDAVIEATLRLKGTKITAAARVFCAPPDFAPDRRPFASLSEELIDRDPVRFDQPEDLQDALLRVSDLFQRAYETASLANLDMTRDFIMPTHQDARRARPPMRTFPDLPAITVPETMNDKDKGYFDPNTSTVTKGSDKEKLALSTFAHGVHGALADADDLEALLRNNPQRVIQMIRPAYARFKELDEKVDPNQHPKDHQKDPKNNQRDPRIVRDTLHDMRMPPFMRDSDYTPLSLNRTQYEFLMDVIQRLAAQPKDALAARVGFRTSAHVARVLERRKAAAASSKGSPDPDGDGG
jgi:hypothetical protein